MAYRTSEDLDEDLTTNITKHDAIRSFHAGEAAESGDAQSRGRGWSTAEKSACPSAAGAGETAVDRKIFWERSERRPWLPWLPWFLCRHGQNRLLDVAILKAQAAQGEGQWYAAGIRNCHVPALGSTASGQPSGAKPAGRTATAQGSTGFGLEMGAKLKYYMGSCWIYTASWIGILQNSKYFQMHLDSFTLLSPCKGRDLLCQESRSWPGW